jgi:hypothetical protein
VNDEEDDIRPVVVFDLEQDGAGDGALNRIEVVFELVTTCTPAEHECGSKAG